MQRHLVLTLCLAGALGACAGEDGKAGPKGAAGAPCTVTTSGNAAVITCPDGSSSTVDPGSCTVASNGDGTHTITCPDGSTIVRDGEKLERGTITGTATRWGLPPEAGIEATLVELDRTASTDATGRFTFGDVRPGLYRIQLSFPGYASVTIPNVALFGGEVDLGATELKVGRLIASGAVMPMISPNETKMALRKDFFLDAGALTLVDLRTGAEQPISNEASEVEFFDDRFVAFTEVRGDGNDGLAVFDSTTGESTNLGMAYTYRILSGGIGWADGLRTHFRPVPGTDTAVLGYEWFAEITDDRRFVVLRHSEGNDLGLLDSESGTVTNAQVARPDYVFSYATGRVAFFEASELTEGLQLSVLDPTTGVRPLAQVPSSTTLLQWSPDGNLLALVTEGAIRIIDVTNDQSATIDLVANPWGAGFGNTGRLLSISNADGATVLDRTTGNHWTVQNSWVAFDSADRWVAFIASESVVLVDTLDGTTRTHDGYVSEFRFSSGGGHVFLAGERTLLALDLATGEETSIATTNEWRFSELHDRVVYVDGLTGLTSIADLATGTVTPTGFAGALRGFTDDERYLFVTDTTEPDAGMMVWLLDVDDGSILPVDEKVLELSAERTGFAYWAGEFPMMPAIAADSAFDPFANTGLYWAVYP